MRYPIFHCSNLSRNLVDGDASSALGNTIVMLSPHNTLKTVCSQEVKKDRKLLDRRQVLGVVRPALQRLFHDEIEDKLEPILRKSKNLPKRLSYIMETME